VLADWISDSDRYACWVLEEIDAHRREHRRVDPDEDRRWSPAALIVVCRRAAFNSATESRWRWPGNGVSATNAAFFALAVGFALVVVARLRTAGEQ
jgi:hypothetical protein